MLFDDLQTQIENKEYTLLEAQETLNSFLLYKQLTVDEYNTLMELINSLEVNDPEDEYEIFKVQIEKRLESIENRLKALEEQKEIEPTPPAEDGSKEKPITAYKGMTYYKDKYYKDPEDSKIYLCTRDNDTSPGTGVALYYLPHELIGHYFQLSE